MRNLCFASSRETTFSVILRVDKKDSRSCGGALCDCKNLGVGVTFGGNDCPKFLPNARMLTQDRI